MKYEFFNVHHVSFDLWLTLIRSNPLFKNKRDELLKDFFSLNPSVDTISERFRLWDVRFTAINESTGRNVEAEEMICIILADLGHDLEKINSSVLAEFFQNMEELFFQFHPGFIEPDLPKYLATLNNKGINLSILSNTGFIKGKLLRKLIGKLDIEKHFKFQAYSDEILCSKPSHEAFKYLFDNANIFRKTETGNILHVGDNKNADVFGAGKAGMQSALINSNQVSLLHLNVFKEKVLS